MTFLEIYNRIIIHWGDNIVFSDGVLSDSDGETTLTASTDNKSFYSNLLSRKWDIIEEIVGTDDTYGDLMVWTMFQVFHRHALQLFQRNIYSLKPTDIDKKEIEEQYFNNLNAGNWEKELLNYERILG